MGLVKTKRLAAMQKQQRAKAGMRLSARKDWKVPASRGKFTGGQSKP